MSKTKSSEIGWYGERLDAVLDRRSERKAGGRPALVGYDPYALAKLLG